MRRCELVSISSGNNILKKQYNVKPESFKENRPMKNTKQIGSRIREVVDRAIEGKVYRSRAAFARTLGMTPQNFKNLGSVSV